MGDRVVPGSVFRRILDIHNAGEREADLTFLTALYAPPRHAGKGRIRRGTDGHVLSIVEERDLAPEDVSSHDNSIECNCPLYVIRAGTLLRHLRCLTDGNAQRQYYITDIVQAIAGESGEIRTLTVTPDDVEYELLCADVTRPGDLPNLEEVFTRVHQPPADSRIQEAARAILDNRHAGQVASIARQLQELLSTVAMEGLSFAPTVPWR